jgi:hypothetical protein
MMWLGTIPVPSSKIIDDLSIVSYVLYLCIIREIIIEARTSIVK